MLSILEHIKAGIYDSPLAHIPLLANFVYSGIALLVGPITGVRTSHYWINVLFAMVVVVLFFLYKFRGKPNFSLGSFITFCFPKALILHPSTMTDIKLKFANNFLMPMMNLTWRLNGVLFTGLYLSGLIAVFGPPLGVFEWNTWSLVVFTIVLFVFDDLGFYICHLAHHRVPALWAFHKVHHSAEVLTPLTATRNHPIEFMLIGPFRSVASSLIMAPALYLFIEPPTVVEVFGMSLVSAFFAMLGEQLVHSHIWLTWPPALQRLIVCPAQHQIHHSSAVRHHDKNMAGQFTFWDWLFGTLYIAPKEREDFAYGIHGQSRQPHPGVVAAYLVPFWDALPAQGTMRRWLPPALVHRIAAWRESLRHAIAARHDAALDTRPPAGS